MDKDVTRKVKNIIEALCYHQDADSIRVLEEIGTNSPSDEIREYTDRALIRKNVPESLRIAICSKGKGINDLSTSVAMSTINELIGLKDKSTAMEILTDTVENSADEETRENARSVKAIMVLS